MIPMLPVEMDNIQAFAITLEKKGGSPTPNLDQLYVIGNLQ
jgi:anti-sigma-K factor RskA